MAQSSDHIVILFYRFIRLPDPEAFRDAQRSLLQELGLKGRMLIAREGVNATFEGTPPQIKAYKDALLAQPGFEGLVFKESAGTGNAFQKLEVKVRDEIVTLGAGEFDVATETAPSISAQDLQKLYEDDADFVVLDLRNEYETAVGKFDKTVDPKLGTFKDLPNKLGELAHLKDKKVVAVCTGGIRCEKATCLLRREGFTDIVQLQDGIHTYMQEFPGEHFKGSLFVFDNRMTTPVVETPSRKIVGTCTYCGSASEDFYNDDSTRPSIKVICCSDCVVSHPELRDCVAPTKDTSEVGFDMSNYKHVHAREE